MIPQKMGYSSNTSNLLWRFNGVDLEIIVTSLEELQYEAVPCQSSSDFADPQESVGDPKRLTASFLTAQHLIFPSAESTQ
jgi:hypothetical protein